MTGHIYNTVEALPEYKVRTEGIVFIDVAAFDWNCPQHITRRYTEPEFTEQQDTYHPERQRLL